MSHTELSSCSKRVRDAQPLLSILKVEHKVFEIRERLLQFRAGSALDGGSESRQQFSQFLSIFRRGAFDQWFAAGDHFVRFFQKFFHFSGDGALFVEVRCRFTVG